MLKRIPVKELIIVVFGAIVGMIVTHVYERTQSKPDAQSVSLSHAYHNEVGDSQVSPPKKPEPFVGLSDEDWKVYQTDEEVEIGLVVGQIFRTRESLIQKLSLWNKFLDSYKPMIKLLKGSRTEIAAQTFFNHWEGSDPSGFEIFAEKWKQGTFKKPTDLAIKVSPPTELLKLEKDSSWPGGWRVLNPVSRVRIVPKSDNANINEYFAKSLAHFDQKALLTIVNTAHDDIIFYLAKIEEALGAVEHLAIQYSQLVVEVIITNSGAKPFTVLPQAELDFSYPMTSNSEPAVISAIVCASIPLKESEQPCRGVTVPGRGSKLVYFISKKLVRQLDIDPPIGSDEDIAVQMSLKIEPPPSIFGGMGNKPQELLSNDLEEMWKSFKNIDVICKR